MGSEGVKVPVDYRDTVAGGLAMVTDASDAEISDTSEKGKVISFPNRCTPGLLYYIVKRGFDFFLSLICLILCAPVFLVIAIAIHHEDGGPVIHRRRCISAKGVYDMLKFRTMVTDADDLEKYMTPEQIAEYHTNIKLREDPRITKIGHFLRKTSLDELPQLLNIFLGQMSFVGPRPVIQGELDNYGRNATLLLEAKPGITGYWQVHGRSDSTYESGKRQQLELYYVNHRSLWLDAVILLRTFPAVLSRRGGY